MEPIYHYNSIQTEFNTRFSIYKVSKNGYKSQIKIINGNENNLFFGIFDEEDVDFEICCDNRDGQRDVCFKLSLDDKNQYIVNTGMTYNLETVASTGKKFHMKSQSTDEGKQLVALSADKHDIPYTEASVLVSKIDFNIEFGKTKILKAELELVGDVIEVLVKSLTGKTIPIKIGTMNTIFDLKLILQQKEGIPPDQQRLITTLKQLEDDKMVSDYYSIGIGSVLHSVLSLRGGTNESADKPNVGERVVVCFGQKSKQKFKNSYFNADKSIELKPFTIELRMDSI